MIKRKPCLTCGKEMYKGKYSQKYFNVRKYCSIKCRPVSIITETWKKSISKSKMGNKYGLGTKRTLETKLKMSLAQRDEKGVNWKGDKVGYSALHKWVKNHLGVPKYCAYCQSVDKPIRSYNWANISHCYRRDLDDWIRLCGKCHKAYDMGKIKI